MAHRRLIARHIHAGRAAAALATALLLAGCVGGATSPDGGFRSAGGRSAVQTASAALVVEAPVWRVGDRWTYSDGYGLAVDRVEGDPAGPLVRFRRLDDPDQWITRLGFLRQDARSATTDRSVVYRSIAAADARRLEVGRPVVFTREFLSAGKTRVHSTSWVLEGQERISVPAGDFDCYVVVMRTRNPETGWTGFERWWYAPAARHYVRLEYRYGDQPVGSRVLTSFALADGVAGQDADQTPASQARARPANSGASESTAPPSASQGPNGSSSPAGASPAPPFDGVATVFDALFARSAATP